MILVIDALWIGLVFWSKLEISNYVKIMAKQLFTSSSTSSKDTTTVNIQLISECISVARSQCAHVNLSFELLIDNVFYNFS